MSAKCDLAKFSIFVVACAALHHITDASKMYHSVRGQEVIKLYVIFNVLEVGDLIPACSCDTECTSSDRRPSLLFIWTRPSGLALLAGNAWQARRRLAASHPASWAVCNVCRVHE